MKVGQKKRLEVATGGTPATALAAALLPAEVGPQVLQATVAHDDECPCTGNRAPMQFCTCEIVHVTLERVR